MKNKQTTSFSFIYLEYGEFVELRDMVVPSRGDFLFFMLFFCVCVCFVLVNICINIYCLSSYHRQC
jgi:hypothetical protein